MVFANKIKKEFKISFDVLKLTQVLLASILVLAAGQLFFAVRGGAEAQDQLPVEIMTAETVRQIKETGQAQMGNRQYAWVAADERGDIIQTGQDQFVISGQGGQEKILGMPVADNLENNVYNFSDNEKSFWLTRGRLGIDFAKGKNDGNELRLLGKSFGREYWRLQYLPEGTSEWVDLTTCKRNDSAKDDNNITVKRTCFSDDGTTLEIIYDFKNGSNPKITAKAYFAKERNYRLIWLLDGIRDFATIDQNQPDMVKLADENGQALFFDYSDARISLGEGAQIKAQVDNDGGRRVKIIFDLGKRPAGEFLLDPTFGHVSAGSLTASIENTIRGSLFKISENGIASSISAYLANTTSAKNMKAAIYRHSDLALVGQTQQQSVAIGTGWRTFVFADPKPVLTAGQEYILAVWSYSATGSANLYYVAGTSNQGHHRSVTYGNWPNPATLTHNTNKYSIYCTYTPYAVSLNVADGQIDYGFVPPGGKINTTVSGVNDTQAVTNDGGVAENINIRGINSNCPWALASIAGNEQYAHKFCVAGSGSPDPCDAGATWTALTTSYQSLKTGLASGQSQRFDLELAMPSETACYDTQNVDVVVQAAAP